MKAHRAALSKVSGIAPPVLEALADDGVLPFSKSQVRIGQTDHFEDKAIMAIGAISELSDQAGIGPLKAGRFLAAVFRPNLGRLNLDHQFYDPKWLEMPERMKRNDALLEIVDGRYVFYGKGLQFTTPGIVPYLFGSLERSLLEDGDAIKIREIDINDPMFDEACDARRSPENAILFNLSKAARSIVLKLREK